MFRRLVRGPPRRKAWPRSTVRGWVSHFCRIPLLLVAVAALFEAYLHRSHLAVQQPEHELDEPFATSCQEPAVDQPREKAALVMLARNKDLAAALKTVQSIERHFNQWYHYPIVFLNDEPWSADFIATMNATASGGARFEVIPKAEWTYPAWMDTSSAQSSIAEQGRQGILYAGLETYHHMCRFYSGNFYNLEALRDYKWYWRIEPDVDFYCSITYDPFVELARNNKVYGFTIALNEEPSTCPGLFREVADWKEQHGLPTTSLWRAMLAPSWVPWPFRSFMGRFSHRNRDGDAWNMCHYWSNFEIANLDFFRSKDYQDLYKHLERSGGFYYERWGDAPVHALALAMLVPSERVHHFEDLGYRHDWYYQCPANAPGGQLPASEVLNAGGNGDPSNWSPARPGGIGCRCECDGSKTRNYATYCLHRLRQPNTTQRLGLFGWLYSWFW
ncbi:nucleotide-diphospho-sugar transferase [Lasiosphaeria ovina]|uniref:Nucleotide-diphospho-sugar transferase n=1 Tax=Lasiosphaeria ovina TaxID=92902 RepID=A0AAE0TYT8_9PEZI|nr:nucleotide-diphospho-sugar transferase [Lasiosphaeria ovina]